MYGLRSAGRLRPRRSPDRTDKGIFDCTAKAGVSQRRRRLDSRPTDWLADQPGPAKHPLRIADEPFWKSNGGEGGIRTHGPLARTTVFETAPFDHSGTSPLRLGFGPIHGPSRCRRLSGVRRGRGRTAVGMAEREGFEPSVEFPLHTLSRRAPSATRSPLRSLGHLLYQRALGPRRRRAKKSLRRVRLSSSRTPRRTSRR